MRAPIPLLSAVGFLLAAGALAAGSFWPNAPLCLVCVGTALLMLRDRDRQIATQTIDGALGVLSAAVRPIEGERR